MGEIVAGRPCGSVAQWSECLHGMREVLGSSPGRAMCFFLPCDIWWPMWVRARAASSKRTVSSVPAWFRADSGTNLIKQGGNCRRSTVWLGSSVVRVLARSARGPGFESRSGHVLFPPL